MKEIKVVETFAGVGGFRLGLRRASNHKWRYGVVWSNQWEPSTKMQHASLVYTKQFGNKNHSNKDIAQIATSEIPDHDMLVGGFPCQDYSVATALKKARGIRGSKGALWWEIHRIVEAKQPSYILLENVDSIIKSPSKHRGRDFAIILSSLADTGYDVEWRIITASDYGMPQKRKRVFIFAHKIDTLFTKKRNKNTVSEIIYRKGLFAQAFPVKESRGLPQQVNCKKFLAELSAISISQDRSSPFCNSGIMRDGHIATVNTVPDFSGRKYVLKNVLSEEEKVPANFYVSQSDLRKWRRVKGSKRIQRRTKEGQVFTYAEGSVAFPDDVNKPSRTIITAEGGKTPTRFKHVVCTEGGRYRRLTPLELERLCMFPDNYTDGFSDTRRAFLMGNSLVVGVVERIGRVLGYEQSAPQRTS